jgi:hypothetical protein
VSAERPEQDEYRQRTQRRERSGRTDNHAPSVSKVAGGIGSAAPVALLPNNSGTTTRGMDDHKNARFLEADFSGARFHGVNFSNVKISDAWLFNVQISGLVGNLSVNGVDVSAYVEAELNKRHPERLLLAPFDADGMRNAWKSIEGFSAVTLARARALPPDELDVSVDEEWWHDQYANRDLAILERG